jgi:hypothetical protein
VLRPRFQATPPPPAAAPSSGGFGIGKLMSMGFLGKQLYDLGGRPFR